MTSTNRLLVASLLACLPFLNGNMVMYIEAPAGGTWSKTFDDDHNTDHSDWVGYGTTCTENASSSGDITQGTAQGSCNFTGTSQPSSVDQWIFMEWGANITYVGPMVRSKNGDMTSGEFAYAARVETGGFVVIRVCDGDDAYADSNCTTMYDAGFTFGSDITAEGDGMILAVAGDGVNTVLCLWAIDVVGATDYCNSANWGNATYCVSDTATPAASELDAFIDCGGDTDCQAWGTDGPTQSGKGYPDGSQTNVRAYTGSSDGADFSTHTCGGTL